MTAERGNSKGRRTIGGLIQSDWPRRNRGLESEVLQGSSNPERGNNQLVRLERKGSFAGISKPRREATTNLYTWKEKKFCGDLRTHSVATTNLYTEKHEAMNGTGDMARNPRIEGDAVTPKRKVGGQKRGTSLSVTYYRDVATETRWKTKRRRTGNEDDQNENAVE